MKVTLNNRLIPSGFKNPAERLVQEHAVHSNYLLIGYREDPSDALVVDLEADDGEATDPEILREMRLRMDDKVRELLNRNGVINARNLFKTDARIWVRRPEEPERIDGLDVEFSFAGNQLAPMPEGATPPRFTGTLMSSGMNDHGEVSVRLVTNQPVEDGNGREVYQVDLDQPSVDSLRRDRESGKWLVRLPDLYRPLR